MSGPASTCGADPGRDVPGLVAGWLAIAGGTSWCVKSLSILASGDQPPILVELAAPLFGSCSPPRSAPAIATDIGGYATGVLFGKHPMAPVISPQKSWEARRVGGRMRPGRLPARRAPTWLLLHYLVFWPASPAAVTAYTVSRVGCGAVLLLPKRELR